MQRRHLTEDEAKAFHAASLAEADRLTAQYLAAQKAAEVDPDELIPVNLNAIVGGQPATITLKVRRADIHIAPSVTWSQVPIDLAGKAGKINR